jgi:histidinol-phosphate aminotransferase
MSGVLELLRPDLRDFAGYSSARRTQASGSVWLNANESALPSLADKGQGLNRYPEPQPAALRARMAELYGVRTEQLLVTRGSDEGIDLLVRAFCRAGLDGVMIAPPCFGMYAVAARVQNAPLVEEPLRDRDGEWRFELSSMLKSVARRDVRVVFLCSPANPTGQALTLEHIRSLAQALEGRAVLVVDEAYIEFSGTGSAASLLSEFSHLVVLRTLSKAHALAGARIGALLAAPELVAMLGNLSAPYPIAAPSAALALAALSEAGLERSRQRVLITIRERLSLFAALSKIAGVRQVYPSEGNFLLVRFNDRAGAYQRFLAAGVVVRDVSAMPGLEDALRITVGTPEENLGLLKALQARAAA